MKYFAGALVLEIALLVIMVLVLSGGCKRRKR